MARLGCALVFIPACSSAPELELDPVVDAGPRADAGSTCAPRPAVDLVDFGTRVPATFTLEVEASCALLDGRVSDPAFTVDGVDFDGALHRLQLGFHSPDAAPRAAILELDFDGAALTVGLRGGPPIEVPLEVSPPRVDFGSLGVGCRRQEILSLRNISPETVRVESVTLSQTGTSFVASEVSSAFDLPAGDARPVIVALRPSTVSTYAATLEVAYRASGVPGRVVVELTGDASSERLMDEFEQYGRPKIDMLVVVDDTSSMVEEQSAIAFNLAVLGRYLDNSFDYHIGVTSTDGTGRLRPASSSSLYLTRGAAPSAEQDLPRLATSVAPRREGPNLAAGSATTALSRDRLAGAHQGFVRENAALSVIFISDGPDETPGTPEALLNALWFVKGFRNTHLFGASAVTAPASLGTCTSSTADATTAGRLAALTERTYGFWTSICEADWFGALAPPSTPGRDRFLLSRQPVVSTLEVDIDGTPIPAVDELGQTRWTYDYSSNALNFAPYARPPLGSTIRVSYAPECP